MHHSMLMPLRLARTNSIIYYHAAKAVTKNFTSLANDYPASKVLQREISPASKPTLNRCMRYRELPWVKESGLTYP